jgi:hypothetical protein
MHAMAVAVAAAALVASGPSNPIQVENARPGASPATWLPPAYPPTVVEGYASEVSVQPGDVLHLHVSTEEERRYRVEVYRLGWYDGLGARLVTCLPNCGDDEPGHRYGPEQPLERASWPVTDRLQIPGDWVSGYYYALLRITRGRDAGARGYVPFIVVEPARRSQILVQVPVNTWQAYNPWGGKSLYPFNSTDLAPSVRVSFDRPLAYTAQGPFDWEYNLVRFLEHEGYDVTYQTDLDTDRHPESLLQHRLVLVIGHDEYWTKRMRDAFDAARDAGTNLAFMGSNAAYWQVRYEDGGRTLVAYKRAAPDPEPDPALRTIQFRELGRPECALMGVMHYVIRPHQTGPVDYTATAAAATDPWFDGTGFRPGDVVQDVVGNEWDALPHSPDAAACTKPGLTDLFHFEGEPQNADAIRYTAPSGARVFATGAQQWSWALDTFDLTVHGRTLPPDPRLQQFTRNALADLTRPAPPPAIEVRMRRRNVNIVVTPSSDARVTGYDVFRLDDSTEPATGDGTLICRVTAEPCRQRRLRPGSYRFAAVAVDQWGVSAPVVSQGVVIVRRRRRCRGRARTPCHLLMRR